MHQIEPLRVRIGDVEELAAAVRSVFRRRVALFHAPAVVSAIALSSATVQQWLERAQPRWPGFGMVKEGVEVAIGEITRAPTIRGKRVEGLPCVVRIEEKLAKGHTLILSSPEAWDPDFAQFAAELSRALQSECRITCIASPAETWAFPVHEDPEDIVVFQVAGQKRWILPDETSGEERNIVLVPGDALYLPLGTPHRVVGTDIGSLHVTVGLAYESLAVSVARILQELVLTEADDVEPASDDQLVDLLRRIAVRAASWQPVTGSPEPAVPARRRFERSLADFLQLEARADARSRLADRNRNDG